MNCDPNSSKIHVDYKADGEYQRNVTISSFLLEHKLILEEKWIPNFKQYNDKLSAHKSIATKLNITIPKEVAPILIANDARVEFSGSSNSIDIRLNNGVFQIYSEVVSGTIQTVSAAVVVFDKSLNIDAESKTGIVKVNPKTAEKYHLKIQSISGNIIQE